MTEPLTEAAIVEYQRARRELVLGAVLALGSIAFAVVTRSETLRWLSLAPFGAGLGFLIRGAWRVLTYRIFVAWRYLLNHPPRVNAILGIGLILTLLVWPWFVDEVVGIRLNTLDVENVQHAAVMLVTLGLVIAIVAYLLRHSKPALYTFLGAVALAVLASTLLRVLITAPRTPFDEPTIPSWLPTWFPQALVITMAAGAVLAGLALLFGSLRSIFTFFTTVPIGGVWIGTMALVCVLSVMSGFENDLRDKILGSNAHIQVTREDGEFHDWREVKARIDRIPGVVASTPYATSEVVIAADNNGMNVIIKGIDPATVGKVTDLIADLEDPEAIDRLRPLVDTPHDRTVPDAPTNPDLVDPPPSDMPTGGDPIDFSSPDDPGGDAGAESDARPDDTKAGTARPPQKVDVEDAVDAAAGTGDTDDTDADDDDARRYGGDAVGVQHDPPPDDMITSDTPPIDFSEPDAIDEEPVRVVDMPSEPLLPRRTQALPGILVGRELVKQTHLHTGEEVRIVSPLSDPANPDATGTPIPFNRDYRVAGVFYTGMYEYDLKYVYVTLESLQDFLDLGDTIDGIEIRITDADDTASYVPTDDGPGLIRQALGPGYRVVDWRELNRSLFSALKLEKIAMFLVLGIVILVASFSIVGNLIMVVVEKGREIALLKTLGAADSGVMQLFAIQGLLIGVIGTVLGVITGLVACWAGKHYGIPLNPDVYYIDRLPIHVDPESVIAAAAAGIVISIGATFYPAMLAARVRPAAGMRH